MGLGKGRQSECLPRFLEVCTLLLGPIFIREWLTMPRRPRHYMVRAAYLGVMWILGVTAWQVIVGWNRTATLGDTARFGAVFFSILTLYVTPICCSQLTLCSQRDGREKDRRTFVLLMMTDLQYEIVWASFSAACCRLFCWSPQPFLC